MDSTGRPTVSVAMATFNGARYIEDQLRSILAQTLPPAEIVIGDDGSTDGTLAIVQRVAESAAMPIRVTVNERRLGYGSNFLATAARASSTYVAFSDQDDVWHPTKIERSVRALQEPGVVLVAHQMNLVDARGDFLRLDSHGIDRTVRFSAGRADPFGVFFGFTMTFDRRLLDLLPAEGRGQDSYDPSMQLAHDRWVHLLGTSFGSAVLIAEPLADYRQHASQAIGVIPMTRTDRVRKKVRDGPEQVAAFLRIARSRSAMIEAAHPRWAAPGPGMASARQWDVALQRWRRLVVLSDRRACTYTEPSAVRRAAAWSANVAGGGYRSHRAGGLGRWHSAEDLLAGVAGPAVRWWLDRRGSGSAGRPGAAG